MARTKKARRKLPKLSPDAATLVDMVGGGIPLRDAVKAVLSRRGETLASWGRVHGHERDCISRLLGGAPVRYEKLREDLARDLGVSRDWLDEKLDAA